MRNPESSKNGGTDGRGFSLCERCGVSARFTKFEIQEFVSNYSACFFRMGDLGGFCGISLCSDAVSFSPLRFESGMCAYAKKISNSVNFIGEHGLRTWDLFPE